MVLFLEDRLPWKYDRVMQSYTLAHPALWHVISFCHWTLSIPNQKRLRTMQIPHIVYQTVSIQRALSSSDDLWEYNMTVIAEALSHCHWGVLTEYFVCLWDGCTSVIVWLGILIDEVPPPHTQRDQLMQSVLHPPHILFLHLLPSLDLERRAWKH